MILKRAARSNAKGKMPNFKVKQTRDTVIAEMYRRNDGEKGRLTMRLNCQLRIRIFKRKIFLHTINARKRIIF